MPSTPGSLGLNARSLSRKLSNEFWRTSTHLWLLNFLGTPRKHINNDRQPTTRRPAKCVWETLEFASLIKRWNFEKKAWCHFWKWVWGCLSKKFEKGSTGSNYFEKIILFQTVFQKNTPPGGQGPGGQGPGPRTQAPTGWGILQTQFENWTRFSK